MSQAQDKAKRFEALLLPLERQVYFTCLGLMGNREDAEDCAQEAILKAYHAFDSFREQSSFSTWLYSIASRCCLDALRKRKQTWSLDLFKEQGVEAVDETADLYQALEAKERRRLLQQGILQLPPDFRAALVLVDLQNLPYQEAALALDLPLGTVKSRVYRARNALVKFLSQNRELFDAKPRLSGERRETK